MSSPPSTPVENWPLETPINTLALATRHVIEETLPVLFAFHDHDGDWQFMCGTTTAAEDGRVVRLGCVMEFDATLMEFADLPLGWGDEREAVDQPRSREAYEDDDTDLD